MRRWTSRGVSARGVAATAENGKRMAEQPHTIDAQAEYASKLKLAALLNGALLAIAAGVIGLIDAQLLLGPLHGAVFVLWMLYGCAALLAANLLLAGLLWARRRLVWAKGVLIAGVAVPLLGALLVLGGAQLLV